MVGAGFNEQSTKYSLYERVKNQYNYCDYRANWQNNRTALIRLTYDGIIFFCNLCDYRATWHDSLLTHIKVTRRDGLPEDSSDACTQLWDSSIFFKEREQ